MSLLSAAIAVWGWQTGLWIFAIPMILIFEARRLIRTRWSFSLNGIKTLVKLCGGIAGIILLILLIKHPTGLIFSLIQWLPVCGFPLIAANAYSDKGLSFLLQLLFSKVRHLQQGFDWQRSSIDLYTPYFALCLLSASATNEHGVEFYVATAALVAQLLWCSRSKQFNPALWGCLMLIVSGLGFIGHLQLHQFQTRLEQQAAPWLSGLSGDFVDPYQTNTRIGSIEDLKQSNAIVFRVAGNRDDFPLLLREATYNRYGSESWIAAQSKFTPIAQDGSTWNLSPTASHSTSITVSASLKGSQGLLKLPSGTIAVHQLSVGQLSQNQFGTVRFEGDPKAMAYQIQFNPEQSTDSPPTEDDLKIPKTEQPAVQKVLATLNRPKQADAAVLEAVRSYFVKNFQYSLSGAQRSPSISPLSDFLLKNHSGHCEYFASAATLLLREAGIPARYAVGYSVNEFSPLEKQYIVRSRHAHAWTMVYLNGNWQSFDPTPPDWRDREDAAASSLQFLSDLWAFLSFKMIKAKAFVLWLIAPGAVFLFWKGRDRLGMRRRARSPELATEVIAIFSPPQAGLDSDFYPVMQKLSVFHLERQPTEPLTAWLTRLQQRLSPSDFDALSAILQLHFRYRFDPQGLDPEARQRLTVLCQSWLDSVEDLQRREEHFRSPT